MQNIPDKIQEAKDKLPNLTPTPPKLKSQSSAHDLKARLEWGEPALTILDVRSRTAFNEDRILGAMPAPADELAEWAKSHLEFNRDIYVYGETDEETAGAAAKLREAGFGCVAELRGGLAAWKAIAGPIEGTRDAQTPPPPSAYNVVSQMKHHAETQSRDV
ncbi:rhodanese-like domain-containing protein [Kamptonema formosum]|uniref:rhodanese-like domain-containing protein n=1 Tax=Kamptonema formosum TaxID=331992 RepID=UPI00034A7F69|nr:rhodanese-like domain-containing protein [Oscillatoria sp. PCC 10802]